MDQIGVSQCKEKKIEKDKAKKELEIEEFEIRKRKVQDEIQTLKIIDTTKIGCKYQTEDIADFIRWKKTTLDAILKAGVTPEDFYGEEDLTAEIEYGDLEQIKE